MQHAELNLQLLNQLVLDHIPIIAARGLGLVKKLCLLTYFFVDEGVGPPLTLTGGGISCRYDQKSIKGWLSPRSVEYPTQTDSLNPTNTQKHTLYIAFLASQHSHIYNGKSVDH